MKKVIVSYLIVSSILLSGVQAFAATNPNIQSNQGVIKNERTKREVPTKRAVSTTTRAKTDWSTVSTTSKSRTERELVYIDVNGMKVRTMKEVVYVTPIYHQKRVIEVTIKYEHLAAGVPTGSYFTETTEMTETREVEGAAQRYE